MGHCDSRWLTDNIGSSHRNRDRVIGEMVFFQIPWQLTKYVFFARTIVTTLVKEVRISYLFFCFYTSSCFMKDYLMSAVRSSSSSANERWQNAIITLRLTNERSPIICSARANRWSQSSQVSGDVLPTSLPYVKTFSRVRCDCWTTSIRPTYALPGVIVIYYLQSITLLLSLISSSLTLETSNPLR